MSNEFCLSSVFCLLSSVFFILFHLLKHTNPSPAFFYYIKVLSLKINAKGVIEVFPGISINTKSTQSFSFIIKTCPPILKGINSPYHPVIIDFYSKRKKTEWIWYLWKFQGK